MINRMEKVTLKKIFFKHYLKIKNYKKGIFFPFLFELFINFYYF